MMSRCFLFVLLALFALHTQAFVVSHPSLLVRKTATTTTMDEESVATSTCLFGCRVNAKKEKMKRNRENMRKFKTTGKRGLSRRRLFKKAQAAKARQEENEFIAKCFLHLPAPGAEEGEGEKKK